ncbi:MAG: hypothetical protein AAFQ66_18530 [Pseudomonadota bacterium]
MEALIWVGAALSVIGLAGIIWCIFTVFKARRAGLDDDALRAKLQSVVAVNLAAFGVSALGLMAIVVGLFFT